MIPAKNIFSHRGWAVLADESNGRSVWVHRVGWRVIVFAALTPDAAHAKLDTALDKLEKA